MNYINLHTHTEFSILDGMPTAVEYMERARELGMTHLSCTDHGTPSGHRAFQRAAKEAGIIPILGMEGYLSETGMDDRRSKEKRSDGTAVYNHVTLLALNETGQQNLNKYSSVAWTKGFYSKPRGDTSLIDECKEGLVVLSGCMSGLIPKAILRKDMVAAKMLARQYKEMLGDKFFIEVMSTNDAELNHALLAIADEFDIPPVMTTDCHYTTKENIWIEDAMLILSTSPDRAKNFDLSRAKTMDFQERYNYLYPGRTMTFQEIEVYLKDYQTEVERFSQQGITRTDIYTNTLDIASLVGGYVYHEGLDLLPSVSSTDPDKEISAKCMAAMRKLGLDKSQEYVDRLNTELEVIVSKNFSRYFLIVQDIISWARQQTILVGPGRGSSAGSLVCYLLEITRVDPIKYGTLFERFLDLSRGDFPDIDIDIEKARRAEVKEYIRQKYVHVAGIMTFGTFAGKSAVKAAGRVLGIPISIVESATKNNDAPPGADFFEHFQSAKKSAAFCREHPEAVRLARELHGRKASSGMHAAGIVISSRPIEEVAPVETATDPDNKNGPRVKYVALEMGECADVGLIKYDLLGLKTLSVVSDTMDSIASRHKKSIDPWNLPHSPGVYNMLSEGHTKAVFQAEQPALTKLIIKMGGVKEFNDIVVANALVRPGAMDTIGPEYLARKFGKKPVTYLTPEMKSFTEKTYGLPTMFQEDVMMTVQIIGGLTAAESNDLRRGLGKKDVKYIHPFKEKFMSNAVDKIGQAEAEKLWDDIEAGAGYSFNISHAVAYSLITYATAWLKYNYPLEYMTAAIQHEDDADFITDYLLECKRLGIKVLIPHVNESMPENSIVGESIRLGLKNVKYIQDAAAQAIIRNRPYNSYAHFLECKSKRGSGINARAVSSLNLVGGISFPDNPLRGDERDYFYEILGIPAIKGDLLEPRILAKSTDATDYEDGQIAIIVGVCRSFKSGSGWERYGFLDSTGAVDAFASTGASLSLGSMYVTLLASNSIVWALKIDDILSGDHDDDIMVKYLRDEVVAPDDGYVVLSWKERKTKAGKDMAIVTVANDMGQLMQTLIFGESVARVRTRMKPGSQVFMEVTEKEDGTLFFKKLVSQK